MSVQLVCSEATLDLIKIGTVMHPHKKLKKHSDFVEIAFEEWKSNKKRYKVPNHERDQGRAVIYLEDEKREDIRRASKEVNCSMYKFMWMIVSQYKKEEK